MKQRGMKLVGGLQDIEFVHLHGNLRPGAWTINPAPIGGGIEAAETSFVTQSGALQVNEEIRGVRIEIAEGGSASVFLMLVDDEIVVHQGWPYDPRTKTGCGYFELDEPLRIRTGSKLTIKMVIENTTTDLRVALVGAEVPDDVVAQSW